MTVDFPRSWVTPCCMILWGDWLCTDTAGRLTQRSMILQGDWLCADLNQNRWYFNPLVTGQWPRQIRMMKKGGRKSRCTVPLRQCHALSFKSFILEIFLIKCLTILIFNSKMMCMSEHCCIGSTVIISYPHSAFRIAKISILVSPGNHEQNFKRTGSRDFQRNLRANFE